MDRGAWWAAAQGLQRVGHDGVTEQLQHGRGSSRGGGEAHPAPHLSTALRMWAIQVFLSSFELV